MNNVLARSLTSSTPPINDELVNGIAPVVFNQIPKYLDRMIKISMAKLHKDINLKYLGYYFPTPEEELMEDAYPRSGGKSADISQNDVYLCCFKFNYNGIPIPKYIYLPFAHPGNLFTVSGTKYVVMPVITDLVISVKPDHLFVRLHMDKISVFAEQRRVLLNDKLEPELLKMLWVSILKGPNDKMRTSAKTPLALYLLATYGLVKTLSQYCGLDKDAVMIKYDADGNLMKSKLLQDYNVYGTVGEKPKGFDRSVAYTPHKLKVLVRKNVPMSPMVTNILIATIYAFDLKPGQYEIDLVNALTSRNVKKETDIWKDYVGRTVYKDGVSGDKLREDVVQHMDRLDDYVDEIIRKKLDNVNIKVPAYWDLVAYLIDIYSSSINNAKEYNRNMNSVHLDLNYYICYDIIIGFNRAVKQINQKFNKPGSKMPGKDEIKKILSLEISEKVIFSLVKSSTSSLALGQADISNDSLYYKGTAMLENQNRGNGVKRGGKTPFPDNLRTLHAYHIVIGSVLYLIKTAPSAMLRLNPYARFDPETGHVIIPENLEKAVTGLDNILTGVAVNSEGFEDELLDPEAMRDMSPDTELEKEDGDDDHEQFSAGES